MKPFQICNTGSRGLPGNRWSGQRIPRAPISGAGSSSSATTADVFPSGTLYSVAAVKDVNVLNYDSDVNPTVSGPLGWLVRIYRPSVELCISSLSFKKSFWCEHITVFSFAKLMKSIYQ
jgi:hypothetical protein